MCTLCQTRPDKSGLACSETKADAADAGTASTRGFAALPSFTVQQQAAYLTDGYWNAIGTTRHAFDVTSGGTITVNLAGLGAAALETVRVALGAWTAVSGLQFSEASGPAQISFSENQSGAFASSETVQQTIVSSVVNVASNWIGYGAYYLQTYIHEIGHALGLGHAGNYNGSADFASNVHYQEDSWQRSVMSYFSQDENPYVSAGFAYVATPMLADIAAIQALYGPANTRLGGDVYGDNRTATGSGTEISGRLAQTIHDSGGIDTFDFSLRSAGQRIDLREGAFSDTDGRIGNLAIALGTVIENAVGGSGNDTIIGNAAANRLVGNAGNDTLSGGAGDDFLDGGAGDDALSGGAGTDTALYHGAFASYGITRTATGFLVSGEGVDNLVGIETALFTDGAFDFALQRFFAKEVERILTGTAAADTLIAEDARGWTLDGLAGDDRLAGHDGADILRGGLGADLMSGGRGNDTYHVDDVRDVVVELSDEGYDTVLASVSTTLSAHVEALTLGSAAGAIDGTGNRLANTITGNAGDNVLSGLGGEDILIGGAGNDRLDGGTGRDILRGGTGDDIYVVGHEFEIVEERFGEGMDTVLSSVSFKLRGNLETLVLTGSEAIDGTGNFQKNTIVGNDGANVLNGSAGNDTLTGGGGADTFLFASALSGTSNVDRITDFEQGVDSILLDASIFSALARGKLQASSFVEGSAATDADQRIVYEKTTGTLYYDADGMDGAAQVRFAVLSSAATLTADDFFIV